MKLSQREKRFFDLATVGGMEINNAFSKAYSHKDSKVLMTCLSRKKKARPDLFDAINKYNQELFDLARKTQRDAVIKLATDNALHAIEKREILRQIITGEMIIEENVITRNPITKKKRIDVIKRKPSFFDRIRAAELDSKIAGHFAPTTIKHEGGDNFIEFMKNHFKTSNKKIPDVLNESRHK